MSLAIFAASSSVSTGFSVPGITGTFDSIKLFWLLTYRQINQLLLMKPTEQNIIVFAGFSKIFVF